MQDGSVEFALNHMTVPGLDDPEFLALARDTGCRGVEFRNDFGHRQLFGGRDPAEIRDMAQAAGLAVHALSEVKRFNAWTNDTRAEAEALMKLAKAIGARAISLIPVNDGSGRGNGERQANLRVALRELKPMLEDHDLIGNVEPLGFEICSLRYKEEAADAIDALNGRDRFRIIHDTFHHFLAGEKAIFPELTGIVHVSGVVEPSISAAQMTDAHRVLVDARDRLGNLEQISELRSAGYSGAYSFEPFAPSVHGSTNIRNELVESMAFITAGLARHAA